MEDRQRLREEVIKGHARGWSFTPLGGVDGKIPVLNGWQAQPRETVDQAVLWAGAGNVGLRTGRASGVVVVDCDTDTLPAELPPTVAVRTGRGRWHLYYRTPGDGSPVKNSVNKILPRCDIRGDGGQVVFVGSRNLQTGGEYAWADGLSPDDVAMADFPVEVLEWDWKRAEAMRLKGGGKSVREIAELIGVSPSTATRLIADPQDSAGALRENGEALHGLGAPDGEALHENDGALHGNVNLGNSSAPKSRSAPGHSRSASAVDSTTRREAGYVKSALEKECDAVAKAAEGTRNDTLNTAAFNLGQLVGGGYLGRSMVESALTDAARRAGLQDDEIRKTIASGLGKGIESPRRLPPPPPAAPSPRRPTSAVSPSVPVYVLIPGAHIDDSGVYQEIGTPDFADAVIERLPEGTIYRRGGRPGRLCGDKGSQTFELLEVDETRHEIDGAMKLGRWIEVKAGEHKGERVTQFVPSTRDYAGLVLARATTHARVRDIKVLTSYPIFGPGFRRCQPGLHDGVYYDEPAELAGIEPETNADVVREVLDDLLVDFPFESAASQQNAIGALLTPIIRPAIDGNVPLHLINSSLERTGKTKLVEQVIGGIIQGKKMSAAQMPERDEEMNKLIISLLLRGRSLMHLDNIREQIDSPSLASLLTTTEYSGRLLGQSKDVSVPNNMILVGTGNNVRATGEIAKRTVPILLQPKTDAPERRNDFVHPDLWAFVLKQRKLVLSCLIGMVESWVSAGRPPGVEPMGGFDEWAATVGGILALYGYDAWMTNAREWRDVSDNRKSDLRALVETWWQKYTDLPVKATDLITIAKELELFPDVLGWAKSEQGALTAFGMRILSRNIDTPIANWFIRRDTKSHPVTYKLQANKSMAE